MLLHITCEPAWPHPDTLSPAWPVWGVLGESAHGGGQAQAAEQGEQRRKDGFN